MEQLELIGQMYAKAKNHKFDLVVSFFHDYLKTPNSGIYDELLEVYTEALIKLGRLDDAKQMIKTTQSLFPLYYDKRKLALRYIACDMEQEFKGLLETNRFEGKDYYVFGKRCFYNGQYYMAKILFDMANKYDLSSRKKIQEYNRIIKAYENNEHVFRALSYYKFKYLGYELEPGHVIRASVIRNKYNCNKDNDDPMKNERPYLIWKIIDDRIYAFPLTAKLRGDYHDGHVLTSSKYQNYPFDRRLKDKLVCIKERDIEFVDDRIDDEDFKLAIEGMYTICAFNHSTPRNQVRRFMTVMAQEIGVEVNDIITVNEDEEKKLYWVLDKDDENKVYEVLKVEKDDCGDVQLCSSQSVEISTTSNIVDVHRLTFYQKEPLFEQIKNTPYANKVFTKKI